MVSQLLFLGSFFGMAGGGEAGGSNLVSLVLMMAIIVGIFYVLVIRPQKKQQEEHQSMIDSLETDDRVVTAGGIHGKITSVSEDTVKLKVAKDIKLDIDKNGISRRKEQDGNDEA